VGLKNMVTIRLHTGREFVLLHALSIVNEGVVPIVLLLQLAFLFLSILGGFDIYVMFSVVVSLDFE
jgi:hypothetical protein